VFDPFPPADKVSRQSGLFIVGRSRNLKRLFFIFMAQNHRHMDCTMVVAAPVLPVGYVVSARRIANRRIMLAGYHLADFLTRVVGN
jgi:hypothetical protein